MGASWLDEHLDGGKESMRIFILEDEIQGYRSGILSALSGHDLTVATSIPSAVSLYAAKYPFDLLLLDHDMHGFYEPAGSKGTGSEFVSWLGRLGNWWCPRVLSRVFCDECGYSRSEARYCEDEDQDGLPHAERPRVILHSQNEAGRAYMRRLLEAASISVEEMPFSPAYISYLKELQ
jgi:hypothetical protein